MQSTYIGVVDPTAFNLAWTSMFCGLGLTLVLYALYVNLFILAIYILSRRKTAGKNVLLVACCTMFILGTTNVILPILAAATEIQILQALVETGANLGQATFPAELSDLYRCYKIWGSRKAVILFPGALILSIVVIAFVNIVRVDILRLRNYARIYFAMSAVTNLVLVGLTAGRIWWLQRETVHVYKKPMIIVLESGALYCIWTLLLVILFRDDFETVTSVWFIIISNAATQVVNIV
ncbi:hypothetical protein GGX14DRAFT_700974, partial [Mycena pura]